MLLSQPRSTSISEVKCVPSFTALWRLGKEVVVLENMVKGSNIEPGVLEEDNLPALARLSKSTNKFLSLLSQP